MGVRRAPAEAGRVTIDARPSANGHRALGGTMVEIVRNWLAAVVVPRVQILQLLPCAGASSIGALVVVNVLLGLLPVAFILATSKVVGHVPEAVAGGRSSAAFYDLVMAFLLAAAFFLGQQLITPVQSALGERMKRRVDGVLRDETVGVVLRSTGVAPMEDPKVLNALSEVIRLLDTGVYTPGTACSGLLALIGRYVRLAALVAIVGSVATWPAALALGGTTLLFRVGQRGGLRRYSVVWRDVAGIHRRAQYLRELAMGGGAAKELRIFGLIGWLTQHYAEAYTTVQSAVAARRRQIYLRPYLVYTAIGLLVGGYVIASLALVAANGAASGVSLRDLACGVQAASAALLLGEFYPESDVPTQYGMQAMAALDEVKQCLDGFEMRMQGGAERALRVAPTLPAKTLQFDGVSFKYSAAPKNVLNGLQIEFPVGKCTAIVGVNGAGKTTLVKLLTRLHDPTGGAIRADGIDIAQLDPVAWRRQISVIFQGFVRYELSAADNIALGAAHVPRDLELVRRAAAEAGILDVFAGLPLGLETPLAPAYTGGIELSGGQWQRIAIARSLYALRSGARLLILDEPTSALDVRAEAAFFDRFVELTRGATSVLVSHRFSSVRRADCIIVMDEGRVVEQGSHGQLMARGGYYASLFRLQAERFVGAETTRIEVPADGHARRPAERTGEQL